MRCIYRVSKIAFETPCMLYIMQISPSYVKNKIETRCMAIVLILHLDIKKNKIVIFTKSHTVYEIKLKLNTLDEVTRRLEIWIRHVSS